MIQVSHVTLLHFNLKPRWMWTFCFCYSKTIKKKTPFLCFPNKYSNIRHHPSPPVYQTLLRKLLYKKHAQVNITNLPRSWKNTAANTFLSNNFKWSPLLLQPYTVNASFCYLVSLAHLLSLNTLVTEALCCMFDASYYQVHWRS